MMRALYRPFGLIISVLGGVLASALVSRVWRAIAHEDESPASTDRDRSWSEILISAALQGAMFGLVKAAVDRAGATGFAHATGTWPGKTSDDT
jgi:hypothetical protein